jgi:hypothetical protein
MNAARSPHEQKVLTLDVDLPQGVNLKTSGDGSAASPPCGAPSNLKEGQSPNPSQSQTRRVHGQGVRGSSVEPNKVVHAERWKPAAFTEGEKESNPNPKNNPVAQSPRSADPPLVANSRGEDCEHCFQAWGHPHHKNCFVVTGRLA